MSPLLAPLRCSTSAIRPADALDENDPVCGGAGSSTRVTTAARCSACSTRCVLNLTGGGAVEAASRSITPITAPQNLPSGVCGIAAAAAFVRRDTTVLAPMLGATLGAKLVDRARPGIGLLMPSRPGTGDLRSEPKSVVSGLEAVEGGVAVEAAAAAAAAAARLALAALAAAAAVRGSLETTVLEAVPSRPAQSR